MREILPGLRHWTLGFVPDALMGEHPDRVKAGLEDALSGLIGGGKTALRGIVERPVGHEHDGQLV